MIPRSGPLKKGVAVSYALMCFNLILLNSLEIPG